MCGEDLVPWGYDFVETAQMGDEVEDRRREGRGGLIRLVAFDLAQVLFV